MKFPWILIGFALAVRLGVVLWLPDTVPYSDFVLYHAAGAEIAADPGFLFDRAIVRDFPQINWWPPGYSIFLSLVYSVTGVDHRAAVFVQVFLGVFVCWLVYRIGVRALGEVGGRAAGILVAFNPTLIFLTNQLASENLFLVWLAVGLEMAARRPQHQRSQVWTGAVLGLAAMTRAIGLVVPVIVAFWLRTRAPTWQSWGRGVGWLVLGCAVILAPWTLRNAVVVGHPALVCFGGGLNFYFGHNPDHIGYRDPSATPLATTRHPAALDRAGFRLGLRYIAERPTHLVTNGARKVVALYGFPDYALHMNSGILIPDTRAHPELAAEADERLARQRARDRWLHGPLQTAARVVHVLVVALAIGGLLLAFHGSAPLSAPGWPNEIRLHAWLVIGWTLAHIVFWAQPRFRVPLEISLALLAALAVSSVARRLGRRRSERPSRGHDSGGLELDG